MTLIYMVRHAEAEGNLYRRAHGQYDSSLTPKGLRQLDALAERFRDTAVDALYSSDLRRTMATAAAVARYHPGRRPRALGSAGRGALRRAPAPHPGRSGGPRRAQ